MSDPQMSDPQSAGPQSAGPWTPDTQTAGSWTPDPLKPGPQKHSHQPDAAGPLRLPPQVPHILPTFREAINLKYIPIFRGMPEDQHPTY